MWTARSEVQQEGRVVRFTIDLDAQLATFADIVNWWHDDAAFRSLFNEVLASAPFTAFRWETPAISKETLTALQTRMRAVLRLALFSRSS